MVPSDGMVGAREVRVPYRDPQPDCISEDAHSGGGESATLLPLHNASAVQHCVWGRFKQGIVAAIVLATLVVVCVVHLRESSGDNHSIGSHALVGYAGMPASLGALGLPSTAGPIMDARPPVAGPPQTAGAAGQAATVGPGIAPAPPQPLGSFMAAPPAAAAQQAARPAGMPPGVQPVDVPPTGALYPAGTPPATPVAAVPKVAAAPLAATPPVSLGTAMPLVPGNAPSPVTVATPHAQITPAPIAVPMPPPPPATGVPPAVPPVRPSVPPAVPTTMTTTTTSTGVAPKLDPFPSIFCFLLMMTPQAAGSQGWNEESLVRQQFQRKAGIFACNEFAVFTSGKVLINKYSTQGFQSVAADYAAKPGEVVSWSIVGGVSGKGAQTNPLNNQNFKNAWKAIKSSGVIEKHNWVVKVDPDAVFFPYRLQWHLKSLFPGDQAGNGLAYVTNCGRYGSMQGPLEVFSKGAALAFVNSGLDSCPEEAGTGEDHFLDVCMKRVGAVAKFDPDILKDQYCDGHVECSSGSTVAFHPFKPPGDFENCAKESMAAEQQWKATHR